jgi:hypothetical protein
LVAILDEETTDRRKPLRKLLSFTAAQLAGYCSSSCRPTGKRS